MASELEILRALEFVNRMRSQSFDGNGFVRPMDVGGTDASTHSRTLAKLCKRGLVERRSRGGLAGIRAAYLYRITAAGIAAIPTPKVKK